jgi:hypothetical protein
MKKIILHAGTHKTGTTALQMFASQESELLRQSGIYYPKSGRPHAQFQDGHHLLPWSAAGRQFDNPRLSPGGAGSPTRVWSELLEEVRSRPEPVILLSSEEFSLLTHEHVQTVAGFLSGFQVVPLLYFRRYDDYIQATYSTVVLGFGEKQTASEYADRMTDVLDYSRMVSAWRASFADTLVCRPFHRHTLISGSILCDILNPLGFDVSSNHLAAFARTNSGVAGNLVECARLLNMVRASEPSTLIRFTNLSRWLYDGHVSYEFLAPSARRTLIARTIDFFEREFSSLTSQELWDHLRGCDLPESDATWRATHGRPYGWLVRTLVDIVSNAPTALAPMRVPRRALSAIRSQWL